MRCTALAPCAGEVRLDIERMGESVRVSGPSGLLVTCEVRDAPAGAVPTAMPEAPTVSPENEVGSDQFYAYIRQHGYQCARAAIRETGAVAYNCAYISICTEGRLRVAEDPRLQTCVIHVLRLRHPQLQRH